MLLPLFFTDPKIPRIRALIMVKNEEAALPRLLKSLGSTVIQGVFLCDTGSTDRTLEMAVQWSNLTGVPVWIHRTNFINFEVTRNECREAFPVGNDDDWVLLLDADFTLRPIYALSKPEHDVNVIQMFATQPGHPHNALNLLVRSIIFKEHCHYRLWTHEYLHCESKDRSISFGFYHDIAINDHADGKSRPEKVERDVRLLKQWLDDRGPHEKDIRPRALYYLARGYEDLGQIEMAERTYLRHQQVQNMTNYNYYAYYRLALLEMRKTQPNITLYEERLHTAAGAYDGIFRKEPLYYLALLYRQRGDFTRCVIYAQAGMHTPPVAHERLPLFMETNIYDWVLEEELGFCLMQKYHFRKAWEHFAKIRQRQDLDANTENRLEKYIQACKERENE